MSDLESARCVTRKRDAPFQAVREPGAAALGSCGMRSVRPESLSPHRIKSPCDSSVPLRPHRGNVNV